MNKNTKKIKLELLKQLSHIGYGHIGGSLSILEVLSVLYNDIMKIDPKNPQDDTRDYLVLSKGHSGPALYSTLAVKGYYDKEMLLTLNANGTMMPSHCDRLRTPGIDMTTGSLGQGISAAVGIAKALKLEKKPNKVFTIVGDGELDEGQCYEAMAFSAHHKLNNLFVIIDENKMQLDGFTNDISAKNIQDRFNAFGFETYYINGHNEEIIKETILNVQDNDKPKCIILDTIKGNGIEFLVNNLGNHHVRFTDDQKTRLQEIIKELEEELQ